MTACMDVALPPEPASVPTGRHFVHDVLDEHGYGPLTDVAELLVSELITNAVKYAGGPVSVAVRTNDVVEVSVSDSRPDLLPVPLGPMVDPVAEGGRGLTLVAQLSDEWGVTRDRARKSVWFRLRKRSAA